MTEQATTEHSRSTGAPLTLAEGVDGHADGTQAGGSGAQYATDSPAPDSTSPESSSAVPTSKDSSSEPSTSEASGTPEDPQTEAQALDSTRSESDSEPADSTSADSASESDASSSNQSPGSHSGDSAKDSAKSDKIVADPEAYRRGSQQLGETGDNLSGQVQQFLSEVRDPGVLGKNDVIGRFGNPMYGVAVGWVGKCLEDLSGAYGDHSEALKDSGRGYDDNETTNEQVIRDRIPQHPGDGLPSSPTSGSSDLDAGTRADHQWDDAGSTDRGQTPGTSAAGLSPADPATDPGLSGRAAAGSGGIGSPLGGAERAPGSSGGPGLMGGHLGAGGSDAQAGAQSSRAYAATSATGGSGGSAPGQSGSGAPMAPMTAIGRGQDRRGNSDMQAGHHLDEEEENSRESVWDALLVQGPESNERSQGAGR